MAQSEKIKVIVPTIGESVSEGTIGRWFVEEGDFVQKDQKLLEIDSDKATLEVAASASGTVSILVNSGKTARVGTEIGVIDTTKSGKSKAAAATTSVETKAEPKSAEKKIEAKAALQPAPTSASAHLESEDLGTYSPSKRRAIRHGTFTPANNAQPIIGDLVEDRRPMTTLRKKIAERLLQSQQTTATLTTFNEINMSRVMNLRAELKEIFEKKFGVKLGFMSFFSKAVIEALKEYPDVNARIDGEEIVYPQGVNLGMAVSTERGLVVPVLRQAHLMGFSQIEKTVIDLAEKARAGKLGIQDMQGGTFTLTNGGVFGSLLSTPIINPPQSGIFGMHKTENRPIAVEVSKGKFEVQVHPMMYVALSYDHRLIDGVTSVGFVVKVKEYLESKVNTDAIMT